MFERMIQMIIHTGTVVSHPLFACMHVRSFRVSLMIPRELLRLLMFGLVFGLMFLWSLRFLMRSLRLDRAWRRSARWNVLVSAAYFRMSSSAMLLAAPLRNRWGEHQCRYRKDPYRLSHIVLTAMTPPVP